MPTTTIDLHRGDVVLVAFPFVRSREVERKRRPAVVIQADRYNRGRAVVILAAITSKLANRFQWPASPARSIKPSLP